MSIHLLYRRRQGNFVSCISRDQVMRWNTVVYTIRMAMEYCQKFHRDMLVTCFAIVNITWTQ
ncbi:MAG: hypothetical protein IPK08_06080 [Bacteroidetes bacterium]|nr:hypothetical protein [Bacteroidota bacterium]